MKKNRIVDNLLDWYQRNKRDLPWRVSRDPYQIWLSEVILQQTRVDQGLPYYLEFIHKYPTVFHLANANIDEVLRTWQGLGYYSRARNLHKCAKAIVNNYQGEFPSEKKQLMTLPGIGPYTAAAISSLAFGRQEAVVDGNVIRVIARLYGIEQDIGDKKTLNEIQKIVDTLIPKYRPDLFNQAIMEFGALHCTPKNPSCIECVFLGFCYAQKNKLQSSIPIKGSKAKKKTRFFTYLRINIHGKYLLRKRESKDIWHGLFEFYLLESDSEQDISNLELPQALNIGENKWHIENESGYFKHQLTHQTIICRFVEIKMSAAYQFIQGDWIGFHLYSRSEIEQLPKSILIDRYLGEKIN